MQLHPRINKLVETLCREFVSILMDNCLSKETSTHNISTKNEVDEVLDDNKGHTDTLEHDPRVCKHEDSIA